MTAAVRDVSRRLISDADVEKWARCDTWFLEEGVMLLLGLEPFDVYYLIWPKPNAKGFDDIYETASRSAAARTLKARQVRWPSPRTLAKDRVPRWQYRWKVSPRDFLAWAQEKEYPIPQDLEEAVNRFHPEVKGKAVQSGSRTAPATAKRTANKRDRIADLKRYIDDVYGGANQGDFDLGSGNDRKALPFSFDTLHSLFLARHPEHQVTQNTFAADVNSLGVKVKSGGKRLGVKELADVLAVKFSG